VPARLCLEYETTTVSNPVPVLTTDCADLEISGSAPRAVIERHWEKLRRGSEQAAPLWESFRRQAHEHGFLTMRLCRVTFTVTHDLPPDGGPVRPSYQARFPAEGPDAIVLRRERVFLRDGSYGFDYFQRGGRDPGRLFDIGRPIARP
jgi:hypothetical protein